MKFKLIVCIVSDEKTQTVIETARKAGATGSTVITNARGEGLNPQKSFLGLSVTGQRDIVLLLVEGHMSRRIMEAIGQAGRFDAEPGKGVVFQLDIEDAVGLGSQIPTLQQEIEDEI